MMPSRKTASAAAVFGILLVYSLSSRLSPRERAAIKTDAERQATLAESGRLGGGRRDGAAPKTSAFSAGTAALRALLTGSPSGRPNAYTVKWQDSALGATPSGGRLKTGAPPKDVGEGQAVGPASGDKPTGQRLNRLLGIRITDIEKECEEKSGLICGGHKGNTYAAGDDDAGYTPEQLRHFHEISAERRRDERLRAATASSPTTASSRGGYVDDSAAARAPKISGRGGGAADQSGMQNLRDVMKTVAGCDASSRQGLIDGTMQCNQAFSGDILRNTAHVDMRAGHLQEGGVVKFTGEGETPLQ
ncbi:MAG: hypothetical protein HY078_10150 [Elusimicrobia bacterium]|nr:hypothetical protein [Elusimicrobiota bacterium]